MHEEPWSLPYLPAPCLGFRSSFVASLFTAARQPRGQLPSENHVHSQLYPGPSAQDHRALINLVPTVTATWLSSHVGLRADSMESFIEPPNLW
ncbi:hypothetical protein RB195_004052 [Necator americanus]|uniref:Uncharacterized protein n=1 Tax=Necator americanus TaxID=51031 RepID=A0ABR1BGC5_NECAM